MAKKKKIFPVVVSCAVTQDMMTKIEKYMEFHDCKLSTAIRHLIQTGLNEVSFNGFM